MRRRTGVLGRRGSVAVEFALCSSFVLLPLFAGGVDFVEIISAQAQLNTALQSLYLFAYTNPSTANNTNSIAALIGKINAHATHQAEFTAGAGNPAVSYKCMNSSGGFGAYANNSCASGYTKQTYIAYQLTGKVALSAPLPFGLTRPFNLAASGTVRIQ